SSERRHDVTSRQTMVVSLAVATALLALGTPKALAQDQDTEGVPMSLSECLSRALENNLDLAIAKRDPKIATSSVTFRKAVFDPTLGVGGGHVPLRPDTKNAPAVPPNPSTTTDQSARSITDSLNASVAQKLTFGAEYAVRVGGTTSPPISSQVFIPTFPLLYDVAADRPYSWNYGINFKLPLLRGFGRQVNEAALLVAKHNLTISNHELQRRGVGARQGRGDAGGGPPARRR